MTGYGRGEAVLRGRTITVELRSVNNRYLDCTVKLPRIYVFAEDAIKATVQQHISRGKVDVFVTIGPSERGDVANSDNTPMADGYYAALCQLRDDYGLKDDISVSLLSRFQDVFLVEKTQEDLEAVSADLCTVLKKALTDFAAVRALDAAYLGDPSEKVIYLTFDAGYENGCTEQILDVLKKHQVPAAFFLVGSYIRQHPDLVRRMVAEGHTVGNHTMHHYDMSKISDPDAFRRELEDLEAIYQEVVGAPMEKYYRPPQGIYSEENLKQAQRLGYKTVFWSLAYVDWKQDSQPSRDAAFSKLIPRIHPGAVVLLHSTSKTNAEILDELLTKWETLGYRFAPVADLFAREEEEP